MTRANRGLAYGTPDSWLSLQMHTHSHLGTWHLLSCCVNTLPPVCWHPSPKGSLVPEFASTDIVRESFTSGVCTTLVVTSSGRVSTLEYSRTHLPMVPNTSLQPSGFSSRRLSPTHLPRSGLLCPFNLPVDFYIYSLYAPHLRGGLGLGPIALTVLIIHLICNTLPFNTM